MGNSKNLEQTAIRAGFSLLILGTVLLGCSQGTEANVTPRPEKQRSSGNESGARSAAEGRYWMGNMGLGLEVRRGRYRYYDEEGTQQWRNLRELTVIQEGVIFDGQQYWCLSTFVPENTIGNCTARGWQVVNPEAEEEAARISPLEFSVGGVRLGDSAAKIRNLLGEPDRIFSNIADGLRWQYSGLEIDLGERGAFGLKSTNARYCTPARVCPGMAFSEVRQIYGAPTVSDRGSEGVFMEYYSVNPEDTCWLKIALDDRERVKSLAVACAL